MSKGAFISVEGPNGAGKSTFIKTLASKLSGHFPVAVTREPSETPFGEFVKRNEGTLKGIAYARLIWADRYYHIQQLVLPALSEGKVVISDRYIESSIVLQGFDGVSADQVWELNKDVVIPDVSIILLADDNLLAERLQQRGTLSDFEKRMTPRQEIEGYRAAVDFLEDKGFRHLFFQNNTEDDLEKSIGNVFDLIMSTIG